MERWGAARRAQSERRLLTASPLKGGQCPADEIARWSRVGTASCSLGSEAANFAVSEDVMDECEEPSCDGDLGIFLFSLRLAILLVVMPEHRATVGPLTASIVVHRTRGEPFYLWALNP